ncbi:hypothetical protein CCGE525_15160 [Rhizobium jaguaris]|uniref:Uncharacterized protein n=1 Tax=Rhizobium jaguaris TaxID=1312183 RepID=A0A387FMG6_9HYPH|nr:hypothetical protein CCGE525_15160 [Rhizobium jaguaris]
MLASSERHAFRSLTSGDDDVMGVVLKVNRNMRTENCELEKPAFFVARIFLQIGATTHTGFLPNILAA